MMQLAYVPCEPELSVVQEGKEQKAPRIILWQSSGENQLRICIPSIAPLPS